MKKVLFVILLLFLMKTAVSAAEISSASLPPGSSYVFANQSENYYYVVSKNPISQTTVRYDYVSFDKEGAVENYGSLTGSFLISGGGSVHVTITGQTALMIDYASFIKMTAADQKALFTFQAAEGESVLIKNGGAAPYTVSVAAASVRRSPEYDYILKDKSGYITEYRSKSASGATGIPAGGSAYITPAVPITFTMPNDWAKDLIFETQNAPALTYFTVAPEKTAVVRNTNKNFNFGLQNDSGDLPLQPKYDCVNRDAYGGVYFFDTEASGDINVSADGTATITARGGAALTIIMPGEWARLGVSVTESAYPALFYKTIASGKTVSIKNANAANSYSLSGNNAGGPLSPRVSYVNKDANGLVTQFGTDLTDGVFIADGGETIISVVNGYTLNLRGPYEWGSFLAFTEQGADAQALITHTLNPGESVEIINLNADAAYGLNCDSSADAQGPKFDYVFYDGAGYILSYGSADIIGGFTVEGGGRAVITAGLNRVLKIWFPSEWQRDLNITKTPGRAVYEHRVPAGKNAAIKNLREGSVSITTNYGRRFAPLIDFTLRDSKGDVTDFYPVGNYGEINIEGLGEANLTAGKDFDLLLLLPGEWMRNGEIAINEADSPAIDYRVFSSGQSIAIKNSSADFFAEIRVLNKSSAHDYVYKNDEGIITDFGAARVSEIISIGPGSTYSLTVNKGEKLELYMPYGWNDILSFNNAQASVSSVTLKAGECYEIINSDKLYAYTVSVGSISGRPSFDHIYLNSENEITGYGSGDIANSLTITEDSRVFLTANRGADIKIYFPGEWLGDKRITVRSHGLSQVLTHMTVKSGAVIEITNKTDKAYNIKNNSGAGLTEPKYDYTFKLPEIPEAEIKSSYGEIAAQPDSRVTVRAANGYDLKIWFPEEWLKNLTIK